MKAFILEKIATHMSEKKFIKRAIRVDNNVILLEIDKTKYFFDMTKGNSDIYINIEYDISKKFNAPFDITLAKKLTKSKLLEVKVVERILTLKIETNLSFKKEINFIQFEFTGRYTNIIILDKNFIILEALHHISENVTFRAIQPQLKLLPLPSKEINEKKFEIENIEKWTQTLFQKKYQQKLDTIKKNLLNKTDKKIGKLQKILDSLQSEKELLKESEKYRLYADLSMINLYKIKNKYEKYFEVENFDGEIIKIPIPKLRNINEIGNYYYKLSKKMKQKSENIKIEKKNLEEKIEFLNNYKKGVESALTISELNIYKSPKKVKLKEDNIEQFFIDDFIVLVGKNEKGNIKLLKESKANDIWLHIKDKVGAHIIIKTNKKSVPDEVILKSAKLALTFSNQNEGIVDYTQRRNLYIKEKAFVNYVTYKSIKVKIKE
jgi:predicted ribosome quality control (RQC) complex YloA/Tae2 family protein